MKIVKLEYYRLLHSRGLKIALTIESAIVLIHFMTQIVPYRNMIYEIVYPLSLYEKWIGGENSSVYPSILFMLFPIFPGIAYGSTLLEDLKSGYVRNIFIKDRRKWYFIAKLLMSFMSGVLTTVPLGASFILTGIVLPAVQPQAGTFYSIGASSLYGGIFYTFPVLYAIMWILQDAIYMGLLATVSLTAGLFSEHPFVAAIMPFIVATSLYGASVIPGFESLATLYMLAPCQPVPVKADILLGVMLVLVLQSLVYFGVSYKKEIF